MTLTSGYGHNTPTTSPSPYAESFHGDHAVLADLAERAALAENGVERVEISEAQGRFLLRLLRRDGNSTDETLLDPDAFAPLPRHKAGAVTLDTIPSFTHYVGKHQEPGTEVWVDRAKYRFVGVIDDHQAGDDTEAFSEAGWGDHRATCDLKPTKDFQHWASMDGKLLPQYAFAEHVEAGLHCIAHPPAADFLEIAQTLMGSRNAAFRSAQRIANGEVSFRYEEQVDGRAGAAGQLEIPQQFGLRLSLFEGTDPVEIVASFRWRLNDGAVSLGYRLVQLDEAVRALIDSLIDQVEDSLDLRCLLGTPRPRRGDGVATAVSAGRITSGVMAADFTVR